MTHQCVVHVLTICSDAFPPFDMSFRIIKQLKLARQWGDSTKYPRLICIIVPKRRRLQKNNNPQSSVHVLFLPISRLIDQRCWRSIIKWVGVIVIVSKNWPHFVQPLSVFWGF
jgi:hypothetical protein